MAHGYDEEPRKEEAEQAYTVRDDDPLERITDLGLLSIRYMPTAGKAA